MKHFLTLIFLCFLSFTVCYSQVRERVFRKIVVSRFEVKPETKFPKSGVDLLMGEIKDELLNHKKLANLKVFMVNSDLSKTEELVEPEPDDETPPEQFLYLTGIVTQYIEGNRQVRSIVGVFAGRAKLKAHIKIADSRGNILMEKDVDGNVLLGGTATGKTELIYSGIAKQLAKNIAKKFFNDE
jgi:Domain of unknown function (DUF4410)